MALDQSALLEVLDALKVADVGDRVRAAAGTVYQALIEAELTDLIRSRVLSTTAGDLELRIPKLYTARSSPACWSAAVGWTRPCSPCS